MKTIINIKGIHCDGCIALLTDVLNDVEGVKKVHVGKDGKAEVEHDEKVKVVQLRTIIEQEGYTTG